MCSGTTGQAECAPWSPTSARNDRSICRRQDCRSRVLRRPRRGEAVMLDVHVLCLPGLPKGWVEQRRESLDAAGHAAGHPVFVHEVEGIDGHLGKSRRQGYAEGTQPYVTHVDHADWVREDAFAILLPHMEAGARAITTGEVQVMPGGSEVPAHDARHHLAVFERSWLWRQQFDRMKHFPDQYLLKVAGESEHISEGVYFHRIS